MRTHFVFATLAAILLAGCTTATPARYTMSIDNNTLLKRFENASIGVVDYTDANDFDAECRMVAKIEASNNRGVAQFVKDSFNEEFQFANLYDGGVPNTRLHLTMDKIAFSSSAGLMNGWWELEITLRNDANDSVSASTRYDFPTAFDGTQACNITGQALTPAVQDLIKQTIQQRDFRRLVGTTR